MKYIISIYLLFFTIYADAQVPQRMSYQAVIRNANNSLLSQQMIGVRISILQADTAGTAVYIETHYTKTNLNGLMTLQIGGGLKFFGDFESINWSTGRYFVKTETDPDGGSDYRITGYSELLSVPYALFSGGQSDIKNMISKADLDSTNNFDINLKGNISASKNVMVKGNIEALGITSTLGTIDKPFKGLFLSAGSLSIASDTLNQNIPATVLSNVTGNLQISAGGVKLMGENTSFIAPNIVGALSGNASTATKLQTARSINNIPFDGTANITIATTSPNSLTYTNTGTGEVPGGAYDGSLAKTISYNSIGASPLAGSSFITSVGTLTSGSVPYTLLSGTIPTWNQSTTGNAATATYATSAGTLSGTIPTWNQSTTGNAATATYATSAGTLSGTIPTWNQSTTGNAATATKLAATKNINGVAFDGSTDISITAIADAGTLSGTTLNATVTGSSLTSVGILTSGTWSASTINIANGGTNTNAVPTAGAVVYGNGTSYAMSAVGTSGQYLQSAGAGAPIWAQPGPASIQVLNTTGTYITPAGVKAIIIELVGGGGGSGAIAAATGNNNGTVSGGGGSGAYTRALIINPASSYTFIIGAGGTASAIGVAGGNGGQTSFNAGAITAPGGTGGAAGSALANGTISYGGAGGLAGIGGSFMVPGHAGGTGFSGSVISVAGAGANSYFGDGGVAPAVIDGSSREGVAATGYGAGASGAAAVNVGTGAIGAAGFHGVIIVTEFK